MIKTYSIADGNLAESPHGEIVAAYNPSEEELGILMERHGLDSFDIRAALDPDERGRMESDNGYLFIILKGPKNYSAADNLLFKTISIGIFILKEKMIIVTREEGPIFEQRDCRNVNSLLDALIKMAHSAIVHFQQHLKVISLISDELEAKLNTSMENKHLLNLFTIEKSLVYFLNAINDNAALFIKIKSQAQKIGFSEDNLECLEEIIIDNNQSLCTTQTYSNILSSLMGAKASLVGNNLNVIMKNLNALVIAIAIPSFFAGVGGMSELTTLCETLHVHVLVAYGAFFVGMLLVGALIFISIRKCKFLWK